MQCGSSPRWAVPGSYQCSPLPYVIHILQWMCEVIFHEMFQLWYRHSCEKPWICASGFNRYTDLPGRCQQLTVIVAFGAYKVNKSIGNWWRRNLEEKSEVLSLYIWHAGGLLLQVKYLCAFPTAILLTSSVCQIFHLLFSGLQTAAQTFRFVIVCY